MALLIDNTHDSAMAAVGTLLYAKLHDSTWEVRDTALEVLCTISHNAFKSKLGEREVRYGRDGHGKTDRLFSVVEFPSFRDIVLDADLPSLILKMVFVDGEAFVRATAVKCLQQMVKVEAFWGNLLKNGNVYVSNSFSYGLFFTRRIKVTVV